MKKLILAAAALALVGAGCVAVQDSYETQPAAPSAEGQKEAAAVGSGTLDIDLPEDSALLPRDESWNSVTIKNVGRPYSLEIHPWWHWDATAESLRNEGALFANSQALLHGGSSTGAQFRIALKGMTIQNATSLSSAVEASMIDTCDIFEGVFESWETCIGHTEGGVVRGLALRNDGSYELKAQLLVAEPAEDGVGYFLHALKTFKEQPQS